MFQKNIEAKIGEILRTFKNKLEAENLKRILCEIKTCKYNTMIRFQLNRADKILLSLNGNLKLAKEQ